MLPGEEDEEANGDFVSPNKKKRSRSVKPRKSTSNKYDYKLVSLIMSIVCLSY